MRRCPCAAGGRRTRSCRRQHTRRRGRRDAVAQRGDVEDAAARGDDRAVALGGARVDDLGPLRAAVQAGDDVARGRRSPGSRARRARPSPRRAGPTRARRPPGRPAASRARSRSSRSRAQPRQHGLGLRVAEAHVELEHLRAVRGQHQAGVEDAVERRAAARQLVEDRLVDLARTRSSERRRRSRRPARRRPSRPCWGRCRRRRCACSRAPGRAGARARRRRAPAATPRRPSRNSSTTHRVLAEAPLDQHRLERLARLAPRRRRSRRPCPRPARRP